MASAACDARRTRTPVVRHARCSSLVRQRAAGIRSAKAAAGQVPNVLRSTGARHHACVLASLLLMTAAVPARADDPPPPTGTCPAGTVEPLARTVAPSLVRVEGPGGFAYGFVFKKGKIVVAPLGVVEAGRGIIVRGPTRDVRHARVAVADPDHDIALLEIATPLPGARPLEPSTERLERGTTVLGFAAVEIDAAPDAVTPGVITRVEGDRFQTSA